ncbi:MAG: formimidoylglutamate deiminase, partial [Myxococcota bacterium]|nr:formimidoylglutamate deiminase [Myxococcota bacterium]
GSDGGVLSVGAPADFVALDLAHYSIDGATSESLLSDVVLASKPDAVVGVWVAGEAILTS